MAQTRITYDVSTGGKVHSDATTAMIRHWARDVDADNGIHRAHSNKGINPKRSIFNETYFPTDGPRDEWITPGSTEEIEQRLQDRLATVTGRTRKDSVLMRGIVLGLSPEWVEEHTPLWKTDHWDRAEFMDALQPVVDIVIEKAGGAKNVMLVSGHFDEEAPQIQIAVTPVTEDGRLRQNDFELFKSPKNLGGLHKKIRKELKESGLDVIMESSERSREHLSNLEFARMADQKRAKEIEDLDKERKEIAKKRDELADAKQQRDDAKQQRDEMKQQRDDAKQEHDDAKKYRKEEEALFRVVSGGVTAKYDELLQLREDVEAAKSSRDEMTQLDSDFMDHAMTLPGVPEEYERFKQGRVRGVEALDTEKREYYERTVGENNEIRERFINNSKKQSEKWQQQKQLEEEDKDKNKPK